MAQASAKMKMAYQLKISMKMAWLKRNNAKAKK
jgi:hypothetical protein